MKRSTETLVTMIVFVCLSTGCFAKLIPPEFVVGSTIVTDVCVTKGETETCTHTVTGGQISPPFAGVLTGLVSAAAAFFTPAGMGGGRE